MRDIFGIDATAQCSDGINKAYVIAPEDLKKCFDVGRKWVEQGNDSDVLIRCKALIKKSKEPIISDNINTILDYSNPKKQAIYHISMEMGSQKNERSFEVVFQNQEYPNLIQVNIGGSRLEETQTIFNRMIAEVSELTRWYWPIACRRWLRNLSIWFTVIIFILFFSYSLLTTIGTIYHNHQINKRYENFVKTHPKIVQEVQQSKTNTEKKTETQTESVTPFREIWNFISNRYFLGAIAIFFLGCLTILLVNYLFPKAVFEIGKGKNRHDHLKAVRKWLGWLVITIIVTGIVSPIISHYVLKLI